MMTPAQRNYIMNNEAWVTLAEELGFKPARFKKADDLRAEAIRIFNQDFAYEWDWERASKEDASNLISIMKRLKEGNNKHE